MGPRKLRQKLERMAYDIYANNYEEKQLLLAGINTRGLFVARHLANRLKEITPIQIDLVNVNLDTKDPANNPVEVDLPYPMNGKTVIIVDDVANTGRTLLFATKPFLAFTPKKVNFAVLVDREHKQYPVFCEYVGLSLSTTIQEHIEVTVTNGDFENVSLL
jgi:pyrimidine operon attenuation protein/uracil phosphoribosyltransferase